MAGDPLLVVQHHPGVGGRSGCPRCWPATRWRTPDRHDRARLGVPPPARRWSAMSTDDTRRPTTRRHRGDALDKRPSAELVSQPPHLRARPSAHRSRGRRVLYARLRATQRGRVGARLARPEVLRWLVRNSLLYPLTGVWVLTRRVVGGAHQRPLRTADARRGSGRGSGPADRVGGPGGTGAGAAASPPDGLDHRAARARPHRRRHWCCG